MEHRNPQGLVWGIPTGVLWATEYRPQEDELVRIEQGGDYGWPLVSPGVEDGTGRAFRTVGFGGSAGSRVW